MKTSTYPRIAAAVAVALSAGLASNAAHATIVGSTYDFSATATGTMSISPTKGTYTDPSNPGFCVGGGCGQTGGMSGSFSFSQPSPTLGTITFTFFGSTSSGLSGTFTINLGNFQTTDGESITGVSYASGSLYSGTFNTVSWNGTTASFTGKCPGVCYAVGGQDVTFDVTTQSSVPEPSTLAIFGAGLLGLGAMGAFRRRRSRIT